MTSLQSAEPSADSFPGGHGGEHPIKVLPIRDGWCVAVGKGHYAQPLPREVAVQRATALARNMRLREIGIYDDSGLVERMPVE